MILRNRSSGWKHAKISGHKNEELVKNFLDTNEEFRNFFMNRINKSNAKITKTTIGGLHESNVPSVNLKSTKSKTDLKVFFNTTEIINISIKKSLGGQVYFVNASSFINTFEKQFNCTIPVKVQRALNLFWSAADDTMDIIENFGDKNNIKNYNLQLRHKSLNATTLKSYDEELFNLLLHWFITNASKIARLCFSMGAIRDEEEWSTFLWYINLLGENDIDDIILIDDICEAVQHFASTQTYYRSHKWWNNYSTSFRICPMAPRKVTIPSPI